MRIHRDYPGGPLVKNLPDSAGDARDMGLILGSGQSPGEGNGNPFWYSCLGYPMDRGAWGGYGPWGHKTVRHDLAAKERQTTWLRCPLVHC